MRYLIGALVSLSLLFVIQKFFPEADPLSPGGFLIYSPIFFTLFITFLKRSTTKELNTPESINPKKTERSQQIDLTQPINEQLTEQNLYDFAIKNFPTVVVGHAGFDEFNYTRLLKLLKNLSINTIIDLNELYRQTKDNVIKEDGEKVQNQLTLFEERMSKFRQAKEYSKEELEAVKYTSLKRKQTLLSSLTFFQECLRNRFVDAKSQELIRNF